MSRRHGIFERSPLLRGDPAARALPLADRARATLARPGWVPALPPAVADLLRLCEGRRPTAGMVVAVLGKDPDLAAEVRARLTASAPSPARAPRSLEAALRAPGLGAVVVTALAVGLERAVFAGRPQPIAHAHRVADLAARLAGPAGLSPTRARAAGLLHDVGRVGLLLAAFDLRLTRAVVDECHTDAAAAILTAWRLPAPLVHGVAGRADRDPTALARLVSLADDLAVATGCGHHGPCRDGAGVAWDLPSALVAQAAALGVSAHDLGRATGGA